MAHTLWTPGHSLAAVTPDGLIVLEKGNDELCQKLWKVLNEGVDLSALIHALTQAFSANLMEVPSFAAIIIAGDSLHLAARGAYEVTVRTSKGTEAISAGNVISWEEKRIRHALGWQISSLENATETGKEPSHPIANGVVCVATLSSQNWAQPPVSQVSETPVQEPETEDISHTRAYEEHLDADQAEKTRVDIPETDEVLTDDVVVEELLPAEVSPAEQTPNSAPNPTPEDNSDSAATPKLSATDSMEDLFADRTIASHSVQAAIVRQARDDENPFASTAPQTDMLAQTNVQPEPPRAQTTPVVTSPIPAAPQAVPALPTMPRTAPTPTPQPSQGRFIDSVPGFGQPTPFHTPLMPSADSDTDGRTVPSGRQAYLRSHIQIPHSAPSAPVVNDIPLGTPMVFALLCANGHPNPTHINICRVCQGTLGTSTTQVPQPPLGQVHFSTGEILTLDRDIIIGRRPAYRAQPGRKEPHIVPVPSPNQEISRTHCEISINGWDVRVRDLGSNNGTFLLRPGQAPLRVTEGTPAILRSGDILDLGDGVTIRMEE